MAGSWADMVAFAGRDEGETRARGGRKGKNRGGRGAQFKAGGGVSTCPPQGGRVGSKVGIPAASAYSRGSHDQNLFSVESISTVHDFLGRVRSIDEVSCWFGKNSGWGGAAKLTYSRSNKTGGVLATSWDGWLDETN